MYPRCWHIIWAHPGSVRLPRLVPRWRGIPRGMGKIDLEPSTRKEDTLSMACWWPGPRLTGIVQVETSYGRTTGLIICPLGLSICWVRTHVWPVIRYLCHKQRVEMGSTRSGNSSVSLSWWVEGSRRTRRNRPENILFVDDNKLRQR